MKDGILIVGTGGHASSVANVALSCGLRVTAYVDDGKAGSELFGVPVISRSECLASGTGHRLMIAIGDNAVRARVHAEYANALPEAVFPSLVHPSSVIGMGATIGDGTVVMPLAHVGPNSAVGTGCIVNTGASLDHDCRMDDHASLAPRVVCGGNVAIGSRTAISIGAIVKHGISLGRDTVIGAGSYVHTPIGDNVVAYGVPCRTVRTRTAGDPYLG